MNALYFVQINNFFNETNFYNLFYFLPPDQQKIINNFHFKIDRKIYLYSKILVNATICKEGNLSSKELTYSTNCYGKPFVNNFPDIHFNLSHTRNAVAVAILDKSVGVDVEKIRTADLDIAQRCFTSQEYSYITETDIDYRFFEIWTKKEAYTKYIGKGLSIPLNSFNVLEKNLSNMFKTYLCDNYIISICNSDIHKQIKFIELTEKDVMKLAIEFLLNI